MFEVWSCFPFIIQSFPPASGNNSLRQMAEFKEEELALMGPGFVLTYMDDPLRRQLIRQVTFFGAKGGEGGLLVEMYLGGVRCFLLFFWFFCLKYLQLRMKSSLTQWRNVYFQLSHPQKQTKQWVGLTKGIIREDGGYVWLLFRCRNWNYLKQLVRSSFLQKVIVELYLPKSYWLSLPRFWNLKIR